MSLQLTTDGGEVEVGRKPPLPSRILRRSVVLRSPDAIAALTRALDAAGIAYGEAFYVARVPPAADAAAPGQARATDPPSSRAAAVKGPPRRGTQRAAVLLALDAANPLWEAPPRSPHGLTATELETTTGIPFRSLTPRIGELKRAGLIVETGATRPGSMGAEQAVVALTDAGRAACEGLR